MLLVEGGSDDDVLFDDHIGAQIDVCYVTAHDDLRVHHVFPFHADVLKALQDHILTDLVLFLSEKVELRLVVLGHRLHVDLLLSL